MKKKLQYVLVLLGMLAGGALVLAWCSGLFSRQEAAPEGLQICFARDRVTASAQGVSAALEAPLPAVLGSAAVEPVGGAIRLLQGEIAILYVPEGAEIPAVPAAVLACYGNGLSREALEAVGASCVLLLSREAPEADTLHLLDSCCPRVFRGDLQGDITLTTDGKHIFLTPEKMASSEEIFPQRKRLTLEAKELPVFYVVNQHSKVFHFAYCPSVEQMKETNRLYSFDTREELLESGYKPCGSCQP